jgi:hypothetical protein
MYFQIPYVGKWRMEGAAVFLIMTWGEGLRASSANSPMWSRAGSSGTVYSQWFGSAMVSVSVADPDPNPPDPHVFGPPGSGSINQRCGSGSGSGSGSRSFYHQAKKSKKTLYSSCFVTSFWLFIFENDVQVPSKSNKQKTWNFVLLLASWEGQWRK